MVKKLITMCLLSIPTTYGMEQTTPHAKLSDVGIKDLSEFINESEERSPEKTKQHLSEAKEYYHRKSKSADNVTSKVAHAYLGDLATKAGDLEVAALHYNQTGARTSRFDKN